MRTLEPEVTEGPRSDIMRVVVHTPGIHLRHIERETGLPLGQVLYHLDRLERMGLLVSTRDAGFRRYFVAHEVGRSQKRYLAALRHDVPRHILVLLLRGPRTHKQLQDALQIAGSTLTFHLQRLLAADVLVRERVDASNAYSIVEPDTVRRELIYYRESFRDPVVDRFVREELERLPPLDAVRVPLRS